MLKVTRDEAGRPVSIESDGHVVLTGPIRGIVELADGTRYDVSDVAVEVASPDHAAEVAHLVGQRYAAEGHPDDVEWDEAAGRTVQRDFAYDDAHWAEHTAAKRSGKEG